MQVNQEDLADRNISRPLSKVTRKACPGTRISETEWLAELTNR
jgi:hypothetical protein